MFHYFIFLELLHHMCLLYHMPLTISKCFLTCFKIIFRLSSIHIFYGFHLFRNYKIFTCLVFQNVLTVLNTIYQPVFLNNFLGNFLFILSFFPKCDIILSTYINIFYPFSNMHFPLGKHFHKGSIFSFIIFTGLPFSNFYLFVFRV